MALALGLRLVAAVLSRGFAFHDDHFEVVEPAQRWVSGWRDSLPYRSVVYPGLHALTFAALEALGIDDPQHKALAVRLWHAAWSTLTVLYGYRVARALAGPARALLPGLLLAAFWLGPFASVHSLVETACQPALVVATWLLVRCPGEPSPRDGFLSGLWLGLAFTIRFQTLVYAVALGLVLLAQRRFRAGLALGAGLAASSAVLLGGSDLLWFGRPFSSLLAYVAYNSDPVNVASFPRGPWYQYLATLAGVLLPPASLLLLWGAARGIRSRPLLFWPALAFLALHSAYPGKQERFLFPVLPAVLILAGLGAQELREEGPAWLRRPGLWRASWGWFWGVNLLLLALYTTSPSKRTRVEPLSFLRGRPDLAGVVLETVEQQAPWVPTFYLGRDVPVHHLPAGRAVDDLVRELAAGSGPPPNYLVLTGEARLAERQARLAGQFPRLTLLATFSPGAVDWLLWRLNPRRNVNLVARVYRIEPDESAARIP